MAKIYGLFGSMTGKLADTVMSVRNGEQIARKYQPIVFNPSSPAQVAQRAKMKLMSQLSAIMANSIAIPREGNVSSRNLFTKYNFPLTSYDGQTLQASITLADVQLTKSALIGPEIQAFTRGADSISVSVFSSSLPVGTSRVVYILCKKVADTVVVVGSRVATEPGLNDDWGVTFPLSNVELIVYTYAMRDNSEGAKAKFGDLKALSAESIAKLIVTRTVNETDVTITRTNSGHLEPITPPGNNTVTRTGKK